MPSASQDAFRKRVIESYEGLSGQLKQAARYVLEHPTDVALLTMREQARRAGVQAATMTRFAQQLGLAGYEQVREAHADALRAGSTGFAARAGVVHRQHGGGKALASAMLASLAAQVEALSQPASLDAVVAAAECLAGARRVFCLSLRSMHPVAWHFHYVMTLIGDRGVLLDGVAGTGTDALGRATADDVLLAATVLPYTRATIEVAAYAASKDIPIVAITDSVVSPLARLARHVVLVPTESPALFHAMAPAFALAEVLAALVADREGAATLDALGQVDQHLAGLQVHVQPREGRKQT